MTKTFCDFCKAELASPRHVLDRGVAHEKLPGGRFLDASINPNNEQGHSLDLCTPCLKKVVNAMPDNTAKTRPFRDA